MRNKKNRNQPRTAPRPAADQPVPVSGGPRVRVPVPGFTTKCARVMVAALFLFLWGVFSFFAADFLRVSSMQEGVYFLGDLLGRQAAFIGGPLNFAAVLLMQALRFPLLGGLLLALLYSGIAAGAIRFFRPGRASFLYAAVLAFLTASLYVRQKYAVFGLDMVRIYLRPPIAAAAAFALALAYRRIVSARRRALAFLFIQLLAYLLLGLYALFFWGLALAHEVSLRRRGDSDSVGDAQSGAETDAKAVPEPPRRWGWVLFLVFPALPWVWYPLFKTQFPIFSPYLADNLPRGIGGVMASRVAVNRFLFIALALLFALAPLPALARRLFGKGGAAADSRFLDAAVWFLIVLLPVIFVVSAQWDRNFRLMVGMAAAVQDEDWDKILTLEARSPNPTTAMIETRRLALTEKGEVQKFFDRPFFGAPLAEPAEVSSLRIIGPELLIRIGSPNIARRHAMDQTQVVRTPVSPRAMRTQVLCCLVLEEYDLADRFLTLLERSIADRRWAGRWRRVYGALRDGDQTAGEETLRLADRIRDMRSLRPSTDITGGFEKFLYAIYIVADYREMEQLARRYQEMHLVHVALLQDQEKFRRDFEYYYRHTLREGEEPIPPLFQDLLLYWGLTQSGSSDGGAEGPRYPVSAERAGAYAGFRQLYDSVLRQTNVEYQAALEYQLTEKYGQTVWYYFAASDVLVNDY
ncbi:MAG: hypothetical protein IKE64_09405 [Thermoguttaceae bacterium]|nr:hypothetical protein [Thermoguttaceae bacterium]